MTLPVTSNIAAQAWRHSRLTRAHRAAIHLLELLGLMLAACQPIAAPPAPEASYMLMVINGSGGGKYPAGSTVHVWANPYQQGWTFDTWRGKTQPIPDIRSMHATLTMPAENIRIEATYQPIPAWSASFATMLGRQVYYYFPRSDYEGVILFFHGSGGEAREWSDLGAERRHFFDDVVAEGYAVIAIDSADRVDKQWDLSVPPLPTRTSRLLRRS